MLNGHSESIVIPGVSNDLVTGSMNENYGPSLEDGMIVFFTSERPSKEAGSIEPIWFITTCIIQPGNEMICQTSLVSDLAYCSYCSKQQHTHQYD